MNLRRSLLADTSHLASIARATALLTLAAASSIVGVREAAAGPPEDAATVVQRLEEELTTAFNKYDVASLDRLWDEDLTFVFPNGSLASKAERLAGMKERPLDIPQSANESLQVKTFGNVAVVVVVSKWPGTREGKPHATRFRATHVWANRANAWKLVAAHVSLMKE